MTTEKEHKIAAVYLSLIDMAHAQEQSLQQQRDSVPKLGCDLSLIQIHALQAVADTPVATDAVLAAQLKLPEASLVQAMMRLWDEGFVEVLKSHDEGEAPQYRINEKGAVLLTQYHDLHQRAQDHYRLFLTQYDEASLDVIHSFLNDLAGFLNKTSI